MHITFLTAVLLLLASCCFTGMFFFLVVTPRLIANSVKTNATIVSVESTKGKYADKVAKISYTDLSGNPYTGSVFLNGTGFTGKNVDPIGKEIAICYNPYKPKLFIMNNRPGRLGYTIKRSAVVMLLVLFGGIAILFLAF